MKKFKNVLFYVALAAAVIFLCAYLFSEPKGKEEITYDDILKYFYNGEVE